MYSLVAARMRTTQHSVGRNVLYLELCSVSSITAGQPVFSLVSRNCELQLKRPVRRASLEEPAHRECLPPCLSIEVLSAVIPVVDINDTMSVVVTAPCSQNQPLLQCRTLLSSPLRGCLLIILRIDLNVVVSDNKNHGSRAQEQSESVQVVVGDHYGDSFWWSPGL